MKSYGVTIQMKPLQQHFHMVPFIRSAVLLSTSEFVDEILFCDLSETSPLLIHDLAVAVMVCLYFLPTTFPR